MNSRGPSQTGGERRHWVFDPTQAESIAPIASKLIHEDVYFAEEDAETTLAKVLDRLLDELPEDQRLAVRAVYLTGMTQRAAARSLGVDHKTVKLRAQKGIDALRRRLTDSAWLADLLAGAVPSDEVPTRPLAAPNTLLSVLSRLNNE
jgi:DNA-directed RNA polymerase specialized sigma24 family protein